MLKLKHFKSSVMTAIRRDANIIYLLLKSVLTASYFLKNIATKKNGAYLFTWIKLRQFCQHELFKSTPLFNNWSMEYRRTMNIKSTTNENILLLHNKLMGLKK